mgnify:CR=1 FL=1
MIQAYFGDMTNTYRQKFTAMVRQAGESVNGIYETVYRDFNRETFDRTYAEFKEILLGAWWRDAQERKEVSENGER